MRQFSRSQMDRNTTEKDLAHFKSHDEGVCGFIIAFIALRYACMREFSIVTTTPKLKDLYQHVTPQYAVQWKVIGTLLDVPSGELDIIEHNNFFQVKECCNAMWNKWLKVDTTASWGKLINIIKSPAVSSPS